MKILSLLILCLFLATGTFAQNTGNNTITGTVKDSLSKIPLEYATITLFNKNASTPVTGTVTDKTGKFSLKGIGNGVFTLVFEFIGYKPVTVRDMQLSPDRAVAYHMGILLPKERNTLEGVTVVAQNSLVENKIDKLVYNAEKDLSSQTGVATDILKKVPQVSIDADGNVELSGSTGVRFLINGKPSTAFGSNIADVLQSIPASEIKSIEVITNPGARYDAQGIGGIINIILKTNKTKGYNGNLSLSVGTRLENGSFNFAVRNNNFGFNAFISGNKKRRVTTPAWSDRTTTDTTSISTLQQMGNFQFERHGFQAGMGFDWTVKKFHSVSGAVSFNNFGSSNVGATNQNFWPSNLLNTVQLSHINTDNNFHFNNIDASLTYNKTFAREGQELEIGINSSFGKDRKSFLNEQFLLPQDSLYYGTNSWNPGRINETALSFDYTQPLKKETILAFGGKASLYTVSSTSDIWEYQSAFKKYLPKASLSDELTYKQKVLAAYAEISFPVSDWFNVKMGSRYERTEISSYFSNAQKQVNIPGYNTLVPSVYLSKKLPADQTLKLSYSKRIERPDYEDLNPFINTNDPKNLTAGNPYLQPEISHRFELAYNREVGKKGSVMLAMFYRINEQDIQPYIVYHSSFMVGDSSYHNVSVNTRQNIGRENNIGLNIFANYALTSKLSLRTNIIMFRRHTINVLNSGYNYNSFNYRINLNASYQFCKTILAECFGNFRSARHEAQGAYPSFTTYSFALRKQFWKQKGSLALTADNFLHEYITQNTVLNGPSFSSTGVRKIPSRSFGLNFTWKFGRLELKKSKPENEGKDNPQEN